MTNTRLYNIGPPKWTDICPECGRHHKQEIRQAERTQERIQHLRHALRIACAGDESKVMAAMTEAEKKII